MKKKKHAEEVAVLYLALKALRAFVAFQLLAQAELGPNNLHHLKG